MRFHVLGIGSIGSLVATHLRRALPPEHWVHLLHKTDGQAAEAFANGGKLTIERNGIPITAGGFVSEVFDANNVPRRHLSTRPKPVQEQGRIESLFVTVKAHNTVPAIQTLLGRLTPNSTIVLLQNGMGIYEELVETIFRNPRSRPHFILASNTHGVYRQSGYKFVHAGVGSISFGIVPDPARDFEAGRRDQKVPSEERHLRLSDIVHEGGDEQMGRYQSLRSTVAAMLLLEGLNVSWQPIADVQTAMRQKVVINSIINPLTAIMNCRNGEIFRTQGSKQIAQKVCYEAEKVFSAQLKTDATNYVRDHEDEDGIGEMQFQRLSRNLTDNWLMHETQRIAQLTAGNVSSMLQDIRKGRPTEIDYINGYLMNLGRVYNIPTPTTTMLYNLVRLRHSIPLDQNIWQ